MELNNESCYRLVPMLYLEIQKGKEAIKESDFQQDIGETDACMNISTKATKGCGQLS